MMNKKLSINKMATLVYLLESPRELCQIDTKMINFLLTNKLVETPLIKRYWFIVKLNKKGIALAEKIVEEGLVLSDLSKAYIEMLDKIMTEGMKNKVFPRREMKFAFTVFGLIEGFGEDRVTSAKNLTDMHYFKLTKKGEELLMNDQDED